MVDTTVLSQWVVNVGRRPALARLAHLLCEMAVRHRAARKACALEFDFPLTQAQIADAIGMTPVHVNRTLKALAHVVSVKGGVVHILDWQELTQLAGFQDDYLQTRITPRLRLCSPETATWAPRGRNSHGESPLLG